MVERCVINELWNVFIKCILAYPLNYGSPMKRAVSISIGSAKRHKAVKIQLLGETIQIERIGTASKPFSARSCETV